MLQLASERTGVAAAFELARDVQAALLAEQDLGQREALMSWRMARWSLFQKRRAHLEVGYYAAFHCRQRCRLCGHDCPARVRCHRSYTYQRTSYPKSACRLCITQSRPNYQRCVRKKHSKPLRWQTRRQPHLHRWCPAQPSPARAPYLHSCFLRPRHMGHVAQHHQPLPLWRLAPTAVLRRSCRPCSQRVRRAALCAAHQRGRRTLSQLCRRSRRKTKMMHLCWRGEQHRVLLASKMLRCACHQLPLQLYRQYVVQMVCSSALQCGHQCKLEGPHLGACRKCLLRTQTCLVWLVCSYA